MRVQRPARNAGERSHLHSHAADQQARIWDSDEAVDSWQLGMLLINLLTGHDWLHNEFDRAAQPNQDGALISAAGDFDLVAVKRLRRSILDKLRAHPEFGQTDDSFALAVHMAERA